MKILIHKTTKGHIYIKYITQ